MRPTAAQQQRPSQSGFGLVQVTFLLLAMAAVALASNLIIASKRQRSYEAQSFAGVEDARKALIAFVAKNGRLPCPAAPQPTAGAKPTGQADPQGATTTCNHSDGILPWIDLGLSETQAQDYWKNYLSYRVWQVDASHSLTQAGGMDMTYCNTNGTATGAVDASGLCSSGKTTSQNNYLLNKGFTVRSAPSPAGTVLYDPANRTGAAAIVFSHGRTGQGAITSSGVRTTLPTSTYELPNTQAAPSAFISAAMNASDANLTATDFFDYKMSVLSVSELATLAGRPARDWGVIGGGTGTGSATSSSYILGLSTGNQATTTLTPNDGVTQSIVGSGNLWYNGTGHLGGLGVVGGGANSSMLNSGETITITFTNKWYKIAMVTTGVGSGTSYNQYGIVFYNGTTQVASWGYYAGNYSCIVFTNTPNILFDKIVITSTGTIGIYDYKVCDQSTNCTLTAPSSCY